MCSSLNMFYVYVSVSGVMCVFWCVFGGCGVCMCVVYDVWCAMYVCLMCIWIICVRECVCECVCECVRLAMNACVCVGMIVLCMYVGCVLCVC